MDKIPRRRAKNYSFHEKKLILDAYFKEIAKEDHVNMRDFCSVCGVNYWTLRDWLEAIGREQSRIPELDRAGRPQRKVSQSALPEAVQELILKIKAQNGSWGPLKIKQYLYRHEQILIPQTVIYRLLKAHGLVAERRQPEAGEKNCRRFEYPYPLAAVQMDLLTVILAGGQRLYLVTLLDDFSRFVLNSRFIAVKTMTEVTGVFTEAVRRYGVMDKLLTDCGSEFVSWQSFTDFETLLAALDVEYIASGPDRKENQGKLERWHQTVRQALRERGPLAFGSEAQLWIRHVVDMYNYERPHQALSGLVPSDRFFGMREEIEAELERYRAGERAGQRIYLACRLGDRRVVLSGPREGDLSLYLNGVNVMDPSRAGAGSDSLMNLPGPGTEPGIKAAGLSALPDPQLEEKTAGTGAETETETEAEGAQ